MRCDIASFYIGTNWYGIRSGMVVEAIDSERLTNMPGNSSRSKGFLMYKDQALTIFEISDFVSKPKAIEERRAARNGPVQKSQILILKAPHNNTRFGILVDSLGDIAEIPASQIEAVPAMMTDGNFLIESIVKPQPNDKEKRILIVLSIDKMFSKLSELEVYA